ncbi:MAG: FAD-dependent oxidoreductase [Bacteroidetes bacterium]|nr:MAG: FAD-dependent oxidoreductase [Bacteroidota bacterium]
MGYKQISIKAPTAYNEDMLRQMIARQLKIRRFTFQVEGKSLDARNKRNIHWLLRIAVVSDEIKGGDIPSAKSLDIPFRKRKEKILVVGSGPAGFFSAFVLQKAGYKTTLIDRGSEVLKRNRSIQNFERNGIFDPQNNYAFGEGGAGTFSDGKLTSRSKHISKERQFILQSYIDAGGPEEIAYMAHPHLGTDNLIRIVKNLRQQYQDLDGEMQFETMLEDIIVKDGRVQEVITSNGTISADAVFIAPGHSAYETYRMLIKRGVQFRTKNFALGSRMEHPQEIINLAQWGKESLPGVKAAEYRLTSPGDGKHQVYSFCMCPGGMVVPANAYADSNIVNGMSFYKRDGQFANAACVAGLHPNELAGREISAPEALDMVEQLERSFYDFAGGYKAPSCSIQDFIEGKLKSTNLESSYPLGLTPAPLWEMLPANIVSAMRAGLRDFGRKMPRFESGNLIGLESKTSAPIQVLREEGGLCTGFENLYLIGEGSGYAGGIISSAADGVKSAMRFINS